MTPTVPVTVTIVSQDGVPYAGVIVRARLDKNEIYQGFVISDSVEEVTDAEGVAVLNLFPNAPSPDGLGTQGSTYRVHAAIPGGRALNVEARFPNAPCNLDDWVVQDDAALDAYEQQGAALARQWATKTDDEVVAGQGYGAKKYAVDAQAAAEVANTAAWVATGASGAATTKAGEANASASAAATSEGNALASKTAAQTAQAATEVARDSALAATRIFASTAAGIAGTTAGQYFYVPSTVTGESLILYENVAGVATERKRYPSNAFVLDRALTLGDVRAAITPNRNLAAGAIATPGDVGGITIPNGQVGNGSFIQAPWTYSGTGKAGETLRLRLRFATSATFTRAMTLVFQVTTPGAVTRTATTTVTTVGQNRIYQADYTLQGDEVDVRPFLRIDAGAATASDETISLAEVRPYILTSVDALKTADDRTAETREAIVSAAANTYADTKVYTQVPSVGNVLGTAAVSVNRNLAAGATGTAGDANGITYGTGNTGIGSFLQPAWTCAGAGRTGEVIRLKLRFAQSATFTRTMALTFQVRTAGGSTNRTATVTTIVTGQVRVVQADYTLQGDELDLRPFLNTTGGAATAVDETLSLTEVRPFRLVAAELSKTAADLTAEDREVALKADIIANVIGDLKAGLGNIVDGDEVSFVLATANGGTALLSEAGKIIGYNAPAGFSAQNTNHRTIWAIDGAKYAGKKVRMKVLYQASATFTRTIARSFLHRNTLGVESAATSTVNTLTNLGGGFWLWDLEYTVASDDATLVAFVNQGAVGATVVDESLKVIAFRPTWQEALFSDQTTAETNVDARNARMLAMAQTRSRAAALAYGRVPALIPDRVKTMALTGGDFASPSAAIAGITDASASKRYQVRVSPGTYATAEWSDADYIDFIGTAAQDCVIDGSQANGASNAALSTNSAMFQRRMSRLEGLTIRIKNGRYAIHLESSGGSPNRIQEIINCRVEHLGNDDAPANTWNSQNAIGSGLSSGQCVRLRHTQAYAKNGVAFSYHTNTGFTAPTLVDAEGCSFVGGSGVFGGAVTILPIGSFQPDKCRLVGNVFGGDISYGPSPWIPTTLDKQPANHAEIDVYGHGNSPAVFKNTDFGLALRIDSAMTGAASSIAISGDAVKAIFGDGANDKFYTVPGFTGLAGYVYGWGDVSGSAVGSNLNVLITSLGQRLGDCSVVNKTLAVTVNGGAPINIVFNANYTAQTNATILGIINAALGAAATASLFNPGQRYRPRFADEEQALRNTTGATILMGMMLAFDASAQAVRPMTSGDAAALFAGVAWEDIPAGKSGRVKTKGWLPITDVLRSSVSAFAFGDTFSIDPANPGYAIKGGLQGLLKAIRNDAVQVAPK